MRRSFTLATALGLLAVLSLSASAFAGSQRPMKGHFTVGVVPVEQRCGPNALTIGFAGVGVSTHFGRMTGSGSNCTGFGLATESVAIWNGMATYTAADGSSITLSYEGVQGVPNAGVATAVTTNTVISGTGRFEDAEGSWTGTGELDFTTGVFNGEIAGWIGY